MTKKSNRIVDSRLVKKLIFRGRIISLSGLHIGGTNMGMAIGGIDSAVIRNPIDRKPYIPGSSIKGKMRSLLEVLEGRIGTKKMGIVDNGPCMEADSVGGRLFGTAIGKKDEKRLRDPRQRPSRLIVRDAHLLTEDSHFVHTDLDYTQVKTEVVIDRITARAMPRQIERVPPGAAFQLELVLNIWEVTYEDGQTVQETPEKTLVEDLFRGLRLLEDDYLGGHGSRGSGQIRIEIQQVLERDQAWYLDPGEHPEGKDVTATHRFRDVPQEGGT